MALHLTSLGDQESCGKMPDNCCIYQGDEFIAFEFLQQNKGLYYERTLFSLTKALSQVLFPALGDGVVLLCITAVVALPDCLGIFWISEKRGGVILLVHPPQVVCYLIPSEDPGRDFPREAGAACELSTWRGDVGGIQIHLLQPGVPILPASWNTHGTATELSKGCPSSLGHPVPSWSSG